MSILDKQQLMTSWIGDLDPIQVIRDNAIAHKETVMELAAIQQERVVRNVKEYLVVISSSPFAHTEYAEKKSDKQIDQEIVDQEDVINSCENLVAMISDKVEAPLSQLSAELETFDQSAKARDSLIMDWSTELSSIKKEYQTQHDKMNKFIERYCDGDEIYQAQDDSAVSSRSKAKSNSHARGKSPKHTAAELFRVARKYASHYALSGKSSRRSKKSPGVNTHSQSKLALGRVYLIQLAAIIDCIYTCRSIEALEVKKSEELQASFMKIQTEVNSRRRS